MNKLRTETQLCSRRRSRGFTLLEVMIALVIVAILAAIAYPSYRSSITRSHRAEGKAALLDLANRMERYFIDRNTYATATIAGGGATDVLGNAATENGYYQLQISAQGTTTYTVQAVPQGDQATQDAACGTLTLTNAGVKGITGGGNAQDCWRR